MGPEEQIPVALAQKFFQALEKTYPTDLLSDETRELFADRQNTRAPGDLIKTLWAELTPEDRIAALLVAFELRTAPQGRLSEALLTLPADQLEHSGYVPLDANDRCLFVGTPFPWTESSVKAAATRDWKAHNTTNLRVQVFYTPYDSFLRTVQNIKLAQSQNETKANAAVEAMAGEVNEIPVLDLDEVSPANEVLKPVLEYAVANHVTDVHFASMINPASRTFELRIEMRQGGLLDEFKVGVVRDGRHWTKVLRNRFSTLGNTQDNSAALDTKVKLMVRLPGVPEPRYMDMRIGALAYAGGHEISLRLLDKSKRLPSISELFQYAPEAWEIIKRVMAEPNGVLLVCGPTGSGKTTMLNTLLGEVNTGQYRILTLEDPVEYETPGLHQFDTDILKIGLPEGADAMALGLKSFLRKDPDIIMIGEVRSRDVATIVVQAAVTGHLVFTTMHTESVCSIGERMSGMEIKTQEFAYSMRGGMAQRLVPRVCSHCSRAVHVESVEAATEWLSHNNLPLEWAPAMAEGRATPRVSSRNKRCPVCNGKGYKGVCTAIEAIPYYEDDVQRMMSDHKGSPPSYEVKMLMRKHAWPLMDVCALRMIFAGVTDVEGASTVVNVLSEVGRCNALYGEHKASGRSSPYEPVWEWDIAR